MDFEDFLVTSDPELCEENSGRGTAEPCDIEAELGDVTDSGSIPSGSAFSIEWYKQLQSFPTNRRNSELEWLSEAKASRRQYCSSRVSALAQPKKSVLPFYVLPNSSPARDVSRAALNAVATPRVKELAKAKDHHKDFNLPATLPLPVHLPSSATPRIKELAKPKKFHPEYKAPVQLPIPVPQSALKAVASKRVEELAEPVSRDTPEENLPGSLEIFEKKLASVERTNKLASPKKLHPDYQCPKIVPAPIPPAALMATASKRTVELSKPVLHECPSLVTLPAPVPPAALKAVASSRIVELAQPVHHPPPPNESEDEESSQPEMELAEPVSRDTPEENLPGSLEIFEKKLASVERTNKLASPKKLHPDYQCPKIVPTPIPPAALMATASKRTVELSKPVLHECPSLVTLPAPVPPAALKAVASSRVVELAQPVHRPPPPNESEDEESSQPEMKKN